MPANPSACCYLPWLLCRWPAPLHLPILHVSETHSVEPLCSPPHPPPVPPAPTNTLHPSHVLKFISLFLPSSSSWSALFPPFHLAYLSPLLSLLSDSLITLYQSGLRGSRAQCSIASHSPSLVPSVPVSLPSLPQSLWKRLGLPDIVRFPPRPPSPSPSPLQVRRRGGCSWSWDSAERSIW